MALDYLADTPAPRIVHMFGFSFAALQAQGEFLRVGAGLPQTQIVFKVPTTGDARRYLPALPEEGVSAVAAFVALNRDIVQELSEQRVLTERIVQLPNGVCSDQFCPVSAARRRELQEHWQLPTDRPVVGFCGRFETRKQIDVLLAGLQALDRDTRPCLLLVGRPDHTFGAGVDVRKWLSADVRWIGEQRDMPLVFGALDAYVTASRAEGMSNALLEALACGLPIIASDIPGHRELVTEGENGWLFPVGDAPALAQCLAWLRHAWRSGAWEAYAAASRERAVRQYDQVALSQTYADLYRRLAARSTP
ncbi:MAG: glycosyltransferase family 4 protein [Pirellulales bacterium]